MEKHGPYICLCLYKCEYFWDVFECGHERSEEMFVTCVSVFWIWMRLSVRIKLKVWGWWQKKVQVWLIIFTYCMHFNWLSCTVLGKYIMTSRWHVSLHHDVIFVPLNMTFYLIKQMCFVLVGLHFESLWRVLMIVLMTCVWSEIVNVRIYHMMKNKLIFDNRWFHSHHILSFPHLKYEAWS